MKGKIQSVLWMIIALVFLSACQQQKEASQTVVPQPGTTVEIENLGRTVVLTEAPKRAVSVNQHVTEIMLALGLEDLMVGTAYLDDEILPELQDAYKKVPVLAEQYPSQEVLIAAEPDFVYAGWKSAFQAEALGSIEELEKLGIGSYLHESSSIVGPTMDDVIADIANIGKIFQVEDRAEALISEIKSRMGVVEAKVGDISSPVEVFVYDSGDKEPKTAAQNFLNHLIQLAGGHNIFGDIEKGWPSVSWEEVVNRKPEVIVIIDYGSQTAEQKKAFLLQHPALQDVPAIVQQRFVIVPLSAAAEGIRGAEALEELAKGFYPEKFE